MLTSYLEADGTKCRGPCTGPKGSYKLGLGSSYARVQSWYEVLASTRGQRAPAEFAPVPVLGLP